MRTYRFRAFDKRTGKMVQGGIQFNNTTMELDSIPDLILMQSTGLLDKQGKEIYEGDIIQDENGTAEVVFHRAGFLNKPHNAPPYLITIWEECEVIGNIYSNSELLEVKDGPSGK